MRSAFRWVVSVSLCGACSGAPTPPRLTGSALRVGEFFPIGRLNPVLPEAGFSAEAHYLVFDRLVYRSGEGDVEGGLLEKWEASDGGRKIMLTLRSGVRFHDGTVVNADDLKFTFDAMRDPQNESSYVEDLSIVEGVDRIDDRTVVVRLRRPSWHFVELLDFGVLPAHLLRGVRLATAPFNQQPVGAGPFRVTKLQNGSLLLERFADYYGVKAGLERVTIVYYESDQLWRRLLAHHIETALYIPWSKHRFLGHLGTIKTDQSTRLLSTALCFNRNRKPFDRPHLRKAFAAAIDRKRLVDRTEFGFGVATERLDPKVAPTARFGIEEARRELGGRIVRLGVIGSDSDHVDVAMELQRQLSAADVTLQIEPIRPDRPIEAVDVAFCASLDPQPLEAARYKYGSALDPDLKDVDALFDRIAETKDDSTRKALFQQIEDRVLDEEPLTILFWQPTFSAYRAEYCGYHMVNLFDGLEKMRPCQ